jgi:hypothetical protein
LANIRSYNRTPGQYSAKGTPYASNSLIYNDVVSEIRQNEWKIKQIDLS